MINRHPYVSDAFGDEYGWRKESQVAPIRISAWLGHNSYADQLLVVGDAAGQVDPLTGEGIHTAMVAAKLAALTVDEMFAEGDFSAKSCRVYHERWWAAFGRDFKWSALAARVVARMPIVLDAVAVVGARRGQGFLDFFGEVMTGVKPKSAFLTDDPTLLLAIGAEAVRQVWRQRVVGDAPVGGVPQDIGAAAVDRCQQRGAAAGRRPPSVARSR